MPNQWIIGNPPKMAETYSEIQFTDSFLFGRDRLQLSGYNPINEINFDEYLPYYSPILMRKIIGFLPQIWPEISFIGYYLWMELRDWGRINEIEIEFNFYILALDKTKLDAWRLFQMSKFYLALPSDICGEILEYIYADMIFVKEFILDNKDIISDEAMNKSIEILRNDISLFCEKDRATFISASRDTNESFKIPLMPEDIPSHRQIDFPLL